MLKPLHNPFKKAIGQSGAVQTPREPTRDIHREFRGLLAPSLTGLDFLPGDSGMCRCAQGFNLLGGLSQTRRMLLVSLAGRSHKHRLSLFGQTGARVSYLRQDLVGFRPFRCGIGEFLGGGNPALLDHPCQRPPEEAGQQPHQDRDIDGLKP